MSHFATITNSPLSESKLQLLSDSGFNSPDVFGIGIIENQSLEYVDLHCSETLDLSQDSNHGELVHCAGNELDLEDPLALVDWDSEFPIQLRQSQEVSATRTPPPSPRSSPIFSQNLNENSQEVPDSEDSDIESIPASEGTYEESDIESTPRELDSCNDAVVPNICLEE